MKRVKLLKNLTAGVLLAMLASCAHDEQKPLFNTQTTQLHREQVSLLRLYFNSQGTVLSPQSKKVLDEYLQKVRDQIQQGHRIYIRGVIKESARFRASREYSVVIAFEYAQAVKNYLLARGFTSGQLVVLSQGREVPLIIDEYEVGMAHDVAVEVFTKLGN